jgi:hydrogenase expression/formation protein HypC
MAVWRLDRLSSQPLKKAPYKLIVKRSEVAYKVGEGRNGGRFMCLGIPGKIISIYENEGLRMGKIDFGGVQREACLDYVPEAEVDDYVVVHVGFAISRLSEEEAQETLNLIREIMDIEQELGPGVENA